MASRRNLIKNASLIGALPLFPNLDFFNKSKETIRTAHIGVGGMGKADLNDIASHKKVKVVALCDVDSKALQVASEEFPDSSPKCQNCNYLLKRWKVSQDIH